MSRHWDHLSVFFALPLEIRKVIYTTNAIESMDRCKIIKTRGAFPTDEAAGKLLCLALLNPSRRWTRPLANRTAAINQFVIMYEDRVLITCDKVSYTKSGTDRRCCKATASTSLTAEETACA